MSVFFNIKDTFYQKALRQARIETQEEYREHRAKLYEASRKLKRIKEELIEREDKVEAAERELTEKEKELRKSVADSIKSELADVLSEKKSASEELERTKCAIDEYRDALFKTEERLLDWAKFIEKKELDVILEIQANADKAKKYSDIARERGFEFEKDFANVLKKSGFYNVEVTKASGDFGADILATKDDIRYVIQCKSYTSPVGISAVQEAYAAKTHYGTHIAVVATDNIFTKAAMVLAESTRVVLWDCEKVSQMERGAV